MSAAHEALRGRDSVTVVKNGEPVGVLARTLHGAEFTTTLRCAQCGALLRAAPGTYSHIVSNLLYLLTTKHLCFGNIELLKLSD